MGKFISKFFALIVFLFIIHNSSFIIPAFAAGEFATSYNNVTYEVGEDGVTQVTEGVTLKNLTDNYYASSFSLTIGSTQISDVSALDSQGAMPISVTKQGSKTKIDVKFNQQISGISKEYLWSLKYKSNDFAQKQGKIWEVHVPKISSNQDPGSYSLTLSVPVSFGDPTSILPVPKSQNEAGGRLNFYFNKGQLTEAGILANFGTEQLFDYHLAFHLRNTGVLPSLAKLPLPANTDYQQTTLAGIEPKPENVTLDTDGNYLAWFRIAPKQNLVVNVSGLAKLKFNSLKNPPALTAGQLTKYTSSQKYWEKDSPQIRQKLIEIFKNSAPKTTHEKARLINKYVVSTLSYDESKLKVGNYDRLGGLTALSNPDKALCSEFTDLFITLARGAGIPARMLEGYAFTANQDLRPLSLKGTLLHAWPEYWDENLGWVMIDPTWENTSGGVDYFSKLDLNHLVLSTRGASSEEPSTADVVSVKFSESQFKPQVLVNGSITTPDEMFAGLPFKAQIKIENSGNSVSEPISFSLSSSTRIHINNNQDFQASAIPPYGFIEYGFDLKTNSLWDSFDGLLQLKYGSQAVSHRVLIKSFFSVNNFTVVIIGLLTIILTIYTVVLVLHLAHFRQLKFKKKDDPPIH